MAFFIVYSIIFGAGGYYLVKLIRKGPEAPEAREDTVFKSPARPLSLPDEAIGPAE